MIGKSGVCISAYGLYMTREELIGVFNEKEREVEPKIVEPVSKNEDNEVKEEATNKKVYTLIEKIF